MSAQLVRQEILAFLRTSDPSVHCIRGRWGVGKTFTWNRALSRADERDFSSAWETYHSTFANNEEEVLDVLFGSFQKNVKSISLTNLSGTVKLFKELGARERATELIALYLECHGDSEAVMDLAKSPWGTADIRSRCNQGTC